MANDTTATAMSVTLATSPPSYTVSPAQIEQYMAVACLMVGVPFSA